MERGHYTPMGTRFVMYVLAGTLIWKLVGERVFTVIEPYGWNTAIYVGIGYAFLVILLDEIDRIQRNV